MPQQISDGKGRGFLWEVNDEHQGVVRAIVEPELEDASTSGNAFSWDSLEIDIDATDTMLYVRNDNSDVIHLDYAYILGSNVVCTWTVHIGAATTTPTGTIVTAVNMNEKFSTVAAEATAFSDETAVADGSLVRRVKTIVDDMKFVSLTGVILGKDHYIQFTQVTESTRGSVILVGHY